MTTKLKILYIIIFTILASSTPMLGQSDYTFTTLGQQNGLSNMIINRLAEDGNGFIWLGSTNGLSRYNGYQFEDFASGEPGRSMNGKSVTDMTSDKDGNLWIANENGISKYDIETEAFQSLPIIKDGHTIREYQVNNIFCAHDGTVRLFSNQGLLCELDPHTMTFYPILDSLVSGHQIHQCVSDGQLNIIAYSNRDHRMIMADRNGKITNKFPQDGNNIIIDQNSQIVENSDGTLYLGCPSGLYLINPAANTIRHITHIGYQAMPQSVMSIHRDQQGRLWIGTNAENLYIYDSQANTLQHIISDLSHKSKYNLNSSTIMDILEDSRGIIWMGTWQGVAYTTPCQSRIIKSITSQDNPEILIQDIITCIAQTKDGKLMVGSDGGGITFWEPGNSRHTDQWGAGNTHGLKTSSILAIKTDSRGNIYTGGFNNGFNIISSNYTQVQCFNMQNTGHALKSDFVRDIYIESDTQIWILTNGGGMHIYNTESRKIRHISSDKNGTEPASPYGICIAKAPNNIIMWGTYHGLTCYSQNSNTIQNYKANPESPDAISHNWIYCIHVDRQNRIWVGTANGLNLFDPEKGTFAKQPAESPLSSTCCYAIEEDTTGHLWISTGSGIAKFDTRTMTLDHQYETNDGIISNNFSVNASYTASDGTILFGNIDGMIMVNPYTKAQSQNVPPPTITALLIDYKPVIPGSSNSPLRSTISRTASITLNSRQNNFAIQFACLGYAEKYKYLYRMPESETPEWIDISQRREIDFTSVAPGTYSIQICAQNSNGTMSEPTGITIEVLPPWYESLWFRILASITAIGTIILLLLYRTHNLKEQRKILKLQVAERTEELLATNDELQTSLQKLRSKTIAIEGSIQYAQTIQQALLTQKDDFSKYFETAMVYMPKDIVSGDFFWLKECKGMIFASVIDCTGHGVPGAFMSLIANSTLNEIIDFDREYSPARILSLLSERVSQMLEQDISDNKDGMDMALCRFDMDQNQKIHLMTYAGAKNPVYLQKKNSSQYEILSANRKSIAGGIHPDSPIAHISYSETERKVESGDVIYMFSDGITDNANQNRKRYGKTRLFDLLSQNSQLNMDEQAQIIEQSIKDFAQNTDQRDDISVLGLKIL